MTRENLKVGLIYKVTSPSGKIYIGQTIQRLSSRKWFHYSVARNKKSKGYCSRFSRAIRKYGNDLIWEVLIDNVPSDHLDRLERETIKKYNSYYGGYNCTEGGYGRSGNPLPEESRKKLSNKYKDKGNPFYGKQHTVETKLKMSESSKGQKAWNKGIPHTKESREKMSKSQKDLAESKGKLNWNIVREIRAKYSTGEYSYKHLAQKYGVTKGNIGHIIKERIWIDE